MKALFQDYIISQMLVFPHFIMYCHKVGTCLPWHSWAYVLLPFPHSKITYTMVQVNFRPTPFKLVLKLYLSCLNMADEGQILGPSNASNQDNLYLHVHLPLQKFTCCDITKIDLLPVCCKSYICTRTRANTSVAILVLLVQLRQMTL